MKWNLVVVISEEEVLAELNSFRNKMLIIVVISIILLSLIIERISTSIIKPIKLLVGKVLEISDGDLNVQIDVKGKDELAVLSKEFNGFVTRLRESMGKIKNLVSDSKISNDNIKKSIDNIIHGSQSIHFSSLSDRVSKGILQLTEQTEIVLDNVRDQTASSEESLAALEEISSTSNHMKLKLSKNL